MADPREKLTAKQSAALAALLTEPTIGQAAKTARVAARTLWRWITADPEFATAYRSCRREIVQHAVVQVQQAAGKAVQTLIAILDDREASASAKVSAAKALLDQALRSLELEEIEQRLTDLEERVAAGRKGPR